MMTDKKPEHEEKVVPKGAVEIDEKDLDQAEGGFIWFSPSTNTLSSTSPLTNSSTLTQKVAPTPEYVGPPDDNKTS